MIYFLILSALVFFSLLELCGTKKINTLCSVPESKMFSSDTFLFTCTAFILAMICALRYQTGRDWDAYTYFFDNCLTLSKNTTWERGYVFLNVFFKKYFNSFYFMQFVICSISAFLIYKNIFKNSDFPIFVLFLYFSQFYLTTEMAQTRQFIAMAILSFGNRFIKERKFLKWLLIFILALQFHFSVIFAFPLYFTTYKKCPLPVCVILLLAVFVLTFYGMNVVTAAVLVIGSLPFMPPRVTRLLEMYIYNKTTSNYAEMGTGLTYFGKLAIAIGIMFFCYKNRLNKSGEFCLLNFLIALIFMSVGRNFQVLGRITNYYLICGNGLCAASIYCQKDSFWKGAKFAHVICVFLVLLFYALSFVSNWNNMKFAPEYWHYQSVLSWR